jgi:hypothetical protein
VKHVPLHISTNERVAANDFVSAFFEPPIHPDQRLEILRNRLLDAVKIVPDPCIRRIAIATVSQSLFSIARIMRSASMFMSSAWLMEQCLCRNARTSSAGGFAG